MALKRRKLSAKLDAVDSKAKYRSVIELLGREIHVFTNSSTSKQSAEVSPSINDEPDDFYDLTPEDYFDLMSSKMREGPSIVSNSEIREAELVARRAFMTKAVIRVCFPDNCFLEAEFHPYETIQSLVDLVGKVISQPEQPFHLYTTPPKERIMDMAKEIYSAGFYPGAIVYFSYDLLKESGNEGGHQGAYLCDDILSLNGSDLSPKPVTYSDKEPARAQRFSIPSCPDALAKKPTKPKWFKL